MMYCKQAIFMMISVIPLAILMYTLIIVFLRIMKIRTALKYKTIAIEFIFVLYMLTLLKITGIIGMSFNLKWFINSFGGFISFSNGESLMMFLNFLLFIPLGFLLPVVIKKINWTWKKIFISGVVLSLAIEFLQMFGGRMAEFNDILMNSIGTIIGYLFLYLFKLLVNKVNRTYK